MARTATPELKKYLDKRIFIQLNGNRKITGVLRGFDPFMNLVVDETMEIVSATEKNSIGTVVLRGNSVILVESLEKI
ncbi:like-Sm ribonucleoprotein [Neocallimastix lanati (nom. inval.)]|uniref:Small nuclear ribonucleoprotein G n=1 Tax=Neocallimastix californiae TaxID=1754190 RepID=A0A1Y2A9V7_9FUNG|nr:like-Sm ribonucleoprotein [Neocallimastix sp. JGI-2020a]ORY19343.1 like-Sm ribonucleo protein [Neocallimastix californiae]|eukprot:ORY19343.1 like-Sm ribonucleo protein [Neocallimastix californiae]